MADRPRDPSTAVVSTRVIVADWNIADSDEGFEWTSGPAPHFAWDVLGERKPDGLSRPVAGQPRGFVADTALYARFGVDDSAEGGDDSLEPLSRASSIGRVDRAPDANSRSPETRWRAFESSSS